MNKNRQPSNYSFDLLVWALLLYSNNLLLKISAASTLYWKTGFVTLLILIILTGFLSFIPARIRRIPESVILFVSSIYCFAQAYHFRFFETYFSLSKLTILSELVDVRQEVITKFSPSLLLFLLPPILWCLYLRKNQPLDTTYRLKSKQTLAIVLMILCANAAYYETFRIKDDETFGFAKLTSDSDLYQNMTNKQRFMDRFGYLCFAYRDITKIIAGHGSSDIEHEDEINTYIAEHPLQENEMTGLFEGKNLILIMCESCGIQSIDEQLTPTLYRLSQEGWSFENFYAPLYPSNTNDSEFIGNTSMVPSIELGTTSKLYSYNSYPYSLANLLKNQYGYECNSFHSFYGGFYSREQLHTSLGYARFYALEELGITMPENAVDFLNWPEDSELFEKTMDHTDTSERFMDFIITASGHIPYKARRAELRENYQTVREIKGDSIDEESAYYYAAQMKLDQGLEILLERLEEEGLLSDTVIALYGDHWPYGISSDASLDYFYGNNEYEFQKYRVPFIIWSSEESGEQITTTASTFDIYPTLCNLFNLNSDGALITGNDLFSDRKSAIPFADRSVLSDSFWYNASTGELTILNGDDLNIDEEIKEAHQLLDYGQEILKGNYYK